MILDPIDNSGANIAQLPVRYKKPLEGERFLVPVAPSKCKHINGPFEIDINGADQLIKNWLQNKNTVDFLGVWEQLNNPGFNLVEFHLIKNEAGLNRFTLSVRTWNHETNGIGLIAKAGRYGIALALGIDDKRFVMHPFVKTQIGGMVKVRMTEQPE